MARSYIILKKPDNTYARAFRMLHESFVERKVRAQNVTKTIGGKLTVTIGGTHTEFEGHIRVKDVETGTTPHAPYGSFSDLLEIWSSQNPELYPNDARLYLIDHFGREFRVVMNEILERRFLSVVVEGEDAHIIVPVKFYVVET